jgi:hypothetical protein
MAAKAKRKSSTPAKRKRGTAVEPPTSIRRGEPGPLAEGYLPSLRLSADEMAERRKREAELQQWRRLIDDANRGVWSVKKKTRPPPKVAGKRRGAERTYPYEAIRRVAEELPRPLDKHRSWFFERVRNTCKAQGIKPVPANDRTMGRIIGDLYDPQPSEVRPLRD